MVDALASLTGWRADFVALLAGAVSVLALPPVHAVPLLLLTMPVLLCLIQGARGQADAARRGWWFGFGLYAGGLYWITEAILFEAARFWWLVPFAVPGVAAVLALFTAAAAAVARRARPGWPMALTLAGAWVLSDLARQFVATGFPWNPLGSVWDLPGRVGDILIQPAALVGVHGLTFATVLLAATPLLGWRWRLSGAATQALWFGFGIARLEQPVSPGPDLTVLLVQGNVAQGQKWDQSMMVAIFRRYLALTHDAIAQLDGRPAVVVWPETASPAQLQTDAPARVLIARALEPDPAKDSDLARNSNPGRDPDPANDPGPAVGAGRAAGGNQALIGAVRFDQAERPRNSLFALGAGGVIEGIYDKWHLVPFGEYQPNWLPLGIQVVPGGGFAPGPGPRTLHLPGVPPVGALICYEAIFPNQVIDEADRPAWMVNVTNDAWFGNSAGPRQHLAAARMRAVEEGLPLLRAANTGISAVFDARGHELVRLGMRQTGVLSVRLPGSLPRPFYARLGLLLPTCIGSLSLFFGLSRRTKSLRHPDTY